MAEHKAETAVTKCPDCGETGRYDRRVIIGGRGVYTCPNRHQWQDADETPDNKGYVVLPPAKDALVCRTCGFALTDQEREDYVDQCGPCVSSPPGRSGAEGDAR